MGIKGFLMLAVGVLMAAFFGFSVGDLAGFDGGTSAVVAVAISGGLSFLPMPSGVLRAVALNELAERELIKQFRHVGTWLSRIRSKNNWVSNDVIKINTQGTDPDVLIDNTTYPIAVAARTDDSISISLHKYDTKNTKVTDDELYALPYEKVNDVQMQHRSALEEKVYEHALHTLAPTSHSATTTPVLETTGDDDGTGRKRLTSADVLKLKVALTKLKVPLSNRVLVLTAEHYNDLLLEDRAFQVVMANHGASTLPARYHGFDVYETVYNPVYDGTTKAKKAFDSVAASTDLNGSIAIYLPRAVKAIGTAKRYWSKAEDNPETREATIGFRLYHITRRLTDLGFGALIDGRVA